MSNAKNIAFEWDSWHASFLSNSKLKLDREILRGFLEGNALTHRHSIYFNPIAYSLVKFDWKIFGTATFEPKFLWIDTKDFITSNHDLAEKLRQSEFNRLLTATCAKLEIGRAHV